MLQKLKSHRAQANISEYAITFAVVVATILAMSFYVKRVVQGRIHDGANHIVDRMRLHPEFKGNIWVQYEPYYAKSDSLTARKAGSDTMLLDETPPTSSGIFKKIFFDGKDRASQSFQLPAKKAE